MKVQLNSIRKEETWTGIEPVNHSPAFDYCRKLMKEGVNPKEPLEVFRGEMLAYTVSTIGWGATMKVLENEKQGPRFKKYEPFTSNRIAVDSIG